MNQNKRIWKNSLYIAAMLLSTVLNAGMNPLIVELTIDTPKGISTHELTLVGGSSKISEMEEYPYAITLDPRLNNSGRALERALDKNETSTLIETKQVGTSLEIIEQNRAKDNSSIDVDLSVKIISLDSIRDIHSKLLSIKEYPFTEEVVYVEKLLTITRKQKVVKSLKISGSSYIISAKILVDKGSK